MLTYATEIPLSMALSVDDLLNQAITWLVDSPHRTISRCQLPLPSVGEMIERDIDQNRVAMVKVADSGAELVGFRHSILEANKLDWIIEVVGRRDTSEFWCSVRVSCETLEANPSIPPTKKPVIVPQLLKLGPGRDGPLHVRDEPLFLEELEISKAARLIGGDLGNRLPVVYVSAADDHLPTLNPKRLAKKLAGLAHVAVEPSRWFSFRLRDEVRGLNPYGGAIGIFWPGQAARRGLLLPYNFESATELEEAALEQVHTALLNRRPTPSCSWQGVLQALARHRYEALKADGSTNITSFIEAFDGELQANREQVESAEREIRRLKAELARHELAGAGGDGLLKGGAEIDLYPDERRELLLRVLKVATKNLKPGSRRATVVDDLIGANEATGKSITQGMEEEIDKVLRNFNSLGKREKASLENVGFQISSDGKHHKLVFRGDSRYTFTLPKTPSDYRSGKNCSSQITGKLF